jgi:hypothetical protein
MSNDYPDGVTAADIDALYLPADMEARVEVAEARYTTVAAAMAALDAALKAMADEGDICPVAGYDYADIPTSADLYTPAAYTGAMERHVWGNE